MNLKSTRLKLIGLLAGSTIGMNAQGINLDSYLEMNTGGVAQPTLLSDKYYSNTSGQTYEISNNQFELIYDLADSILININGTNVIGYVTDVNHAGGNYFLCNIEDCNIPENRTYISGTDYFGNETPYQRSSLNMFSGYGNNMVVGRDSNSATNFTISITNNNGVVLDSFTTTGSSFTYGGYTSRYLSSTTGITEEVDFKLITASYNDPTVTFKKWNTETEQLDNLPFLLSDGQDINGAYPTGIAPISISNPYVNENGVTTYKVVLATLASATSTNKLIWGDVKVEDSIASFESVVNTSNLDPNLSILFGSLVSSNPVFHSNNTFTFRDMILDFSKSQELALTENVVEKENREMYANIYKASLSGNVIARELNGNYILYLGSQFTLTSSTTEIDPYIDPSFEITLASNNVLDYYGVEASCTLQTNNATVDSQDYLSLSDTALEIPLEWDSLTGKWKGVQSLTGLDSISGSQNFALFDLTADVTTGTWSMNCSGIASDIKGNSISLASTDITINLDDQIHGGTGLVSGQITMPNTSDYSDVVVTITLNGRQIEVTTEADGSFSFDRLVEGEYQVHLYNDQFVAACNTVTIDSNNSNTPLIIQMYAGDINNDGAVDIGDFSLLSGLMGLTSSDEGYSSLADLNHDGIINVQDLSILGSHFGTDHCEVSSE